MPIDNNQIISNLEAVYQRAINSRSDRVFFQSIFDYIEEFDREPSLVKVNKQIIKLADEDLKTERRLEKQTQREILKVHKETNKHLKTHETGSRTVIEHLQKVTQAWEGNLTSSIGITRQMYDDLTYALMILAKQDNKHLQFCRKYGKVHDNASVADWAKISQAYPKWEDELIRNKRLLRFKIWHAWNEIVEFHNWFADYEIERDKLLDSKKLMELGYVSAKFKAIQAAITGEAVQNNSVIEIQRDEYQRYLGMIHQFIKQKLKQQKTPPEIKEINCEYEPNSGLLTIKNNSISFTPKKTRGLVLGIFLKNKRSRKKKLYWEEIIEKIEDNDVGASTQDQKRHQVYYAIEGINDRIFKKIHINLFSYTDGYVSLNSLFFL